MAAPTASFDLIQRVKNGDEKAYSLLFNRYRQRLAVLVRHRLGAELGQHVEVDDAVQEVFIRAFRDIGAFDYRTPGCFMGWLARIAGNVVVDLARYHNRQARHAELVRLRSMSNPQGPEPVDRQTPSRVLAGKQRVVALLDALPPQYREIIVLARIEGLSTAEMAARLGKSREAVALLLHRAIKRLRELEIG